LRLEQDPARAILGDQESTLARDVGIRARIRGLHRRQEFKVARLQPATLAHADCRTLNRLKLPAEYVIAPHTHPAVEHVTVISGSLYMGMGDTVDKAASTRLPAGGFAVMPIGVQHYAWTAEATTIQLHGIGPWGITYVNPADDPRNQ